MLVFGTPEGGCWRAAVLYSALHRHRWLHGVACWQSAVYYRKSRAWLSVVALPCPACVPRRANVALLRKAVATCSASNRSPATFPHPLRYRDQRDLSQQPESLALHMELRFEQLKSACELELWGEAFRSVEDIQGLIALGKKQPRQSMMATYYARLTQIFEKSESHLYHAFAWLKLFLFSRAFNKGLTQASRRPLKLESSFEKLYSSSLRQSYQLCSSPTAAAPLAASAFRSAHPSHAYTPPLSAHTRRAT